MKYLFLLAVVAIVYVVLARQTPVAAVTAAVTASEVAPFATGQRDPAPPAATSALKRPLDRTHAVLDQAKARSGAGEF